MTNDKIVSSTGEQDNWLLFLVVTEVREALFDLIEKWLAEKVPLNRAEKLKSRVPGMDQREVSAGWLSDRNQPPTHRWVVDSGRLLKVALTVDDSTATFRISSTAPRVQSHLEELAARLHDYLQGKSKKWTVNPATHGDEYEEVTINL